MQAQDSWIRLGEEITSYRLDDIFFIDEQKGWVVGDNGQIHHTKNGGVDWTLQYESNLYFRSIEFLNENVGFAGTLGSGLFKTTNGGRDWNRIDTLYSFSEFTNGFCGFSHIGDSSIFAVGAYYGSSFFLASHDQGNTWSIKNFGEEADGLVDCYFIDKSTGFISGIKEGEGAIILKTSDGGISWRNVLTTDGDSEYIWKLDILEDSIIYGSVEHFLPNKPSFIVKSIDQGDTWIQLKVSDDYLDLQGIGFQDKDTGWVGPRDKALYKTVNGGQTWFPTEEAHNVNRIFRVNNKLFASGTYIYELGSGLNTLATHPRKKMHRIETIWPNPINHSIQIQLRIGSNTHAILDIYTKDGQKIKTIVNSKLKAGAYHYEFKFMETLPLGIYYVSLRTNESFLAKSFLKG